jgi:hypothetical protein
VNEVAERLAFYAIAVNMVAYLVFQMHQSLPDAATHVTDWIGAAFVLTLFGAFCADAYLGRFKTIIIFSCIYAVVRNQDPPPPPFHFLSTWPMTKLEQASLVSIMFNRDSYSQNLLRNKIGLNLLFDQIVFWS